MKITNRMDYKKINEKREQDNEFRLVEIKGSSPMYIEKEDREDFY